jgi:hypothetical protein
MKIAITAIGDSPPTGTPAVGHCVDIKDDSIYGHACYPDLRDQSRKAHLCYHTRGPPLQPGGPPTLIPDQKCCDNPTNYVVCKTGYKCLYARWDYGISNCFGHEGDYGGAANICCVAIPTSSPTPVPPTKSPTTGSPTTGSPTTGSPTQSPTNQTQTKSPTAKSDDSGGLSSDEIVAIVWGVLVLVLGIVYVYKFWKEIRSAVQRCFRSANSTTKSEAEFGAGGISLFQQARTI